MRTELKQEKDLRLVLERNCQATIADGNGSLHMTETCFNYLFDFKKKYIYIVRDIISSLSVYKIKSINIKI